MRIMSDHVFCENSILKVGVKGKVKDNCVKHMLMHSAIWQTALLFFITGRYIFYKNVHYYYKL